MARLTVDTTSVGTDSLAPASARRALLLVPILILAAAISSVWVLGVPFFENPDEIAHGDYVLAIIDAGAPLRSTRGRPMHAVAPQTRYLLDATGYRQMRYDPAAASERPTTSFYRSIDASAPRWSGTMPADGSAIPYVATFYPAAFYVADAVVSGSVGHLTNSLVATFLAMRFFDVALLVATLAVTYAICAELGFSRRDGLLATFAIGCFPMVSWTFASVQPDDATTLLFTASLYAALRFRRTADRATAACLFTILCSLAFIKFHYAAIAALASALACRSAMQRAFGAFGGVASILLFVGTGAAIAVARRVTLVGSSFALPGSAIDAHAGPMRAFEAVAARALDTFLGLYWNGETSQSFWYHFGIRSGTIFAHRALEPIAAVLGCVSVATIAIVVVRQCDVLRRVRRIAGNRGWRRASRLIANEPLLLSYAIVTLFFLAFATLSAGNLTPQGRYWLPVIVPTVLLLPMALPPLLPRRRRNAARTFALALWAGFAAISTPIAIAAMRGDFYHAPRLPTHELGNVENVRANGEAVSDGANVARGTTLIASGSVVDSSKGAPAQMVRAVIDGRFVIAAKTGLPSPALAQIFNDETLRESGFLATIDTSALAPGSHTIDFEAVERRAPDGLSFGSFRFDVAAR